MRNKDVGYYEALPYRIELTFDPGDQVWFARYPELPGCKAHGRTQEEALTAGNEIKSTWIETALEKGESIPEPLPDPTFSGRFVARLPRALHERAAHVAETNGVSLNTYVVEAIAEAVERSGQENLIARVVDSLQKALPQAGAFAWHNPDTARRLQEGGTSEELEEESEPILIRGEEE